MSNYYKGEEDPLDWLTALIFITLFGIFFLFVMNFMRSEKPLKLEEPVNRESVVYAMSSHRTISERSLATLTGILREGTWNINIAYAVMMAESHGNPNSINWKDYHRSGNCWGSFGLFQLACFRGTREELLDPEINVQLAYALWQREGWQPWSAWKNGAYKKFLGN
jgi:hypothetical protein